MGIKLKVFIILLVLGLGLLTFMYMDETQERGPSVVQIRQKYSSKMKALSQKDKVTVAPQRTVGSVSGADANAVKDETRTLDDEKIRKLLEEMERNSVTVTAAWNEFRQELYAGIGLQKSDVARIDQLVHDYDAILIEIADEASKDVFNVEAMDEYNQIYGEVLAQRDQELLNFIGKERFEYIFDQREAFNKNYNEKARKVNKYIAKTIIERW